MYICSLMMQMPTQYSPYSQGMNVVVIVLFCVIPIIAGIATIWAIKGYALTGEKMMKIQEVNNARKQMMAQGSTMEEAMAAIKGDS